ncbi:hypothetical protein ACJX0J_041622, partial [Zea mays]
RSWLVVRQAVPLHLLHPLARRRRRQGELGLRVHLRAARIASEQVACLHWEHQEARAVVDLSSLDRDNNGRSSCTDAPCGRDTDHHRALRRGRSLTGKAT